MNKADLKALVKAAGYPRDASVGKMLTKAWDDLEEIALIITALGGNMEECIAAFAYANDDVSMVHPPGEMRKYHQDIAKIIRKKADIYGQSGGD